jgi:transposase
VIEDEMEVVEANLRARLSAHRGYRPIQVVHGVGPVAAAILVAEIGNVTRFASARQLCS